MAVSIAHIRQKIRSVSAIRPGLPDAARVKSALARWWNGDVDTPAIATDARWDRHLGRAFKSGRAVLAACHASARRMSRKTAIRILRYVRPGRAGARSLAGTGTPEGIAEKSGNRAQWNGSRIKVAEQLWGKHFLEPGGRAEVRNLFSKVMPNAKQTVLDLTVGLGGTAFCLTDEQNLWMEVREPDQALAAIAKRSAAILGVSRQVPVETLALDDIAIREARYDLIYSRDRLYGIPQKLELLMAAAQGLKKHGKLLVTDYTRAPGDVVHPDRLDAWLETEPEATQLWSPQDYARSLKGFGLKVWFLDDLTKPHLANILAGWLKLAEALEEQTLDRRELEPVLAEGEQWLKRAAALDQGGLCYSHIIAGPAEG